MLAPLVIFVYNRPDHIKKAIEALAWNNLASETEVYIFSDAAKDGEDPEKVNLVRSYIDSIPGKAFFKAVDIRKSYLNKGLARSVIYGVSQIIKKYGKVIVVEDDLISSRDFLEYMNEALDYYEYNGGIWSISGFNIPIKIPRAYKSDIYLSYRGCSWGWATWKDRWEKVDWDVDDYDEFKKNKKVRRKFNRGGRDMAYMLDLQKEGSIDSWAIRWCYTQSKLNMYTIYPVDTRIKNIGLDGSGSHSGVVDRYDSVLKTNMEKCNFDNPGCDKQILKRFRDYHLTPFNYLLLKFKRAIKKLARL